jgi:GxxExxY protein
VNEKLDALTKTIIGAALEVHRELGPGLLENAYEACLAFELASLGLSIERQRALPIVYKNQRLDCGYRLDFVVEKCGDRRS